MVRTRASPITPPRTSDSASQTSPVGNTSQEAEDEQPSTSDGRLTIVLRSSSLEEDGSAEQGETPPSRGRRSRHLRHHRAARVMLDACRGIPSSMPVKGESYCDCPKQGRDLKCQCGEEDDVFDWCWDNDQVSAACELQMERRSSVFHASYSSGTAAVRGTQPMTDRQYFWEVKMTSPVYGTDMMVGVGTANVNLGAYRHAFTSLLGRDGESWGLSYYGRKQHKGLFQDIKGAKFGQGTILGVHVDMWHGTVSYYKNRRPLGVAYSGLAGKTLFPMVASTAARTAMKVIKACSFQTSLQFLCCQVLRKMVPSHQSVVEALDLPPGLRAFLENNLSWLLRPSELSRASARTSSAGVKRACSDASDSSDGGSDSDSSSEEETREERTSPPPPKCRRTRAPRHDSTDAH